MSKNTHLLLKQIGYTELDNYGDIARFAASHSYLGDVEILTLVEQEFGKPPKKIEMKTNSSELNIWGEIGTDIDGAALDQMYTCMKIPPALNGALMPDAHLGYAMPIGGVVALDNCISPSFVGYDIACRVTLSILDINVDEFIKNRESIAKFMQQESSFGMGSGFRGKERREHPVMDEPLWAQLPHLKQLHSLAWEQLGSSGGGNHFFDALIGESLTDDSIFPIDKGNKFVAIMTHSGSRGTGHKLATYYVKLAEQETHKIAKGVPSGYEWLSLEKESGQEYWEVMQLMGKYAQANHHLIHEHFSKSSGIGILFTTENHHNFAWKDSNKIIHRKGATPAYKDQLGLIPGTSGTPSYIVLGKGNEKSLNSSSHGAGRPFSRSEAKRRHNQDYVAEWMSNKDIMTFGLAPDETLMAYKDIDRVMELQSDLVTPIAKLYPKIVIMGGKSDDGD